MSGGPFPKQVNESDPGIYNYAYLRGGRVLQIPKFSGGTIAFVADGDTDVAGTVGGVVPFAADARIPNIAGYGPTATFADTADKLNFTAQLGDLLQMDGGGTWIFCVTPEETNDVGIFAQKSSSNTFTRQGWAGFFTDTRALHASTSNNASTTSVMSSAAAAFAWGDRFLFTFTLDGAGNGELYKNCTPIKSQASMQIPSNTASALAVGNGVGVQAWQIEGPLEYAAVIPGLVLDATDLAKLCPMFGIAT